MDLKTTVLLSGGIDSMACVHFLKERGHIVEGLFINYGQAAQIQEMKAAEKVSDFLDISLRKLIVSSEQQFGSGEINGRNAFLFFSALLVASPDITGIACGIHSGTQYYDCSALFFERISILLSENSDGQIRVIAPFIEWSKPEVYAYVETSDLPVDITYSCESGYEGPCGQCMSCQDRGMLECR